MVRRCKISELRDGEYFSIPGMENKIFQKGSKFNLDYTIWEVAYLSRENWILLNTHLKHFNFNVEMVVSVRKLNFDLLEN